jgi:hypothetical protein
MVLYGNSLAAGWLIQDGLWFIIFVLTNICLNDDDL